MSPRPKKALLKPEATRDETLRLLAAQAAALVATFRKLGPEANYMNMYTFVDQNSITLYSTDTGAKFEMRIHLDGTPFYPALSNTTSLEVQDGSKA